jgi:hypothetical protein
MSVTIEAPVTVIKAIGLRLIYKDRNEQVDSCDLSKWKVLAGKLAWDRVASSVGFDVLVDYENGLAQQLVSADYIGFGDHVVSVICGGKLQSQRVIPAEQIISTVRLFVSCQVARRKLDIRVKDFEQLGAFVQDYPITMVIHKRV